MAEKDEDERYPSRELLEGEYPEHRDALNRGHSDDSSLGAMGEPWGGMGVAGAARRPADAADHKAGAVPPERSTPNACAAAGKTRGRSGKGLQSVARKPGDKTLSEIAASSTDRELDELNRQGPPSATDAS
jgi:hypothetical protein